MKLNRMIILAGAIALLSCSSQAADVLANWTQHCASCHGKDGKGDTKAGKKAGVKDFCDAKYQESMTDDKMHKQIKEGMMEKGKERMKPYGDKLKDDEIKALIGYIRAMKK